MCAAFNLLTPILPPNAPPISTQIGRKVMNKFRDSVKAERCSLIFMDHEKSEMFFYQDDRCVRFPITKGLAGYTARTGERLNIPDAYEDKRFNKKVDMQTGFRTKSVLCAPIHSKSGDPGVMAVIQMLNKKGGAFDKHDEEILDNCQLQVAAALDLQFSTLKMAQGNLEIV